MSVTGGSDWKLTFWSWGKAQVVAEIQVIAIPPTLYFILPFFTLISVVLQSKSELLSDPWVSL